MEFDREDRRFLYLEGKIWALECLLRAVLGGVDIGNGQLQKLIEGARRDYPATMDPEGPVGKGFEETVRHVLGADYGTTSDD